jgi:sugar phosphate isomerase/epimerase
LYIDEVPLGTGCVNFEECFRHLDGYTGTFSFEYNASDEEFRKDMQFIESLYTGTFSLEHNVGDEKSRKDKQFIEVLYEK